MTVFLIPYTYRGVSINGDGDIDSQKFELPIPKVLSRIIPVAGGNFMDLNYGLGAKLQPRPFKLIMMVSSSTAINLQAAFDAFFGIPPTGFYGETGTFVAKVHGSFATFKSCTAELLSVTNSQDGNWYKGDNTNIFNLSVTFKPVTLFS